MSGEEILCDAPGAVKHFRPDLAGSVADRAAAIDPRYRWPATAPAAPMGSYQPPLGKSSPDSRMAHPFS